MFGAKFNSGIWLTKITRTQADLTRHRITARKVFELLDGIDRGLAPQRVIIKTLDYLGRRADPDYSIARMLITRLLPWDPIKSDVSQLPAVELFLFTHEKDLAILPLAMSAACTATENPIFKINVVAPEYLREQINTLCVTFEFDAHFISDEYLLNKYLLDSWSTIPNVPKMEILKLLTGLETDSGYSLAIDGDTLLLRKRTWVTSQYQTLVVAQEYLQRHTQFNSRVLRIPNCKAVGFVAHHQLISKKTIEDFLTPEYNISSLAADISKSFSMYLTNADPFPSEWQLVGDITLKSKDKTARLAKFSNYGLSRDDLIWDIDNVHNRDQVEVVLNEMRAVAPSLGSLSLHRYK
jgi:hypothetical protein